jgi:hypothetical protein
MHRNLLLLCGIGLLINGLLLLSPPRFESYFHEGGAIETLCAIFLLVSAVILLFARPLIAHLHLGLTALLLAEREFDADNLNAGSPLRTFVDWVETHILHETVPILVLLVLLITGFVKFSWPNLRGLNWSSSLILHILVVGVAFAVLGQVAGESLKHPEASLSEAARHRLLITEELTEFYFAIAVLVAACLAMLRSRNRSE